MYELNRVLLQSIGPKGARYEDILLDFRDRNADPARGSVLYLENGGGKSVLLKLLFSVLLPGRKFVLGADANTKTLENFVLTGDTGHVVLEWRRVTAEGQALPELLLTGKVYEWRGRQHSSDSQNLREAWYTLRPASGAMSLESLPTRAERDGTRFKRQFASYKEQLEEAHRAHPELDLVWTDVQRKWMAYLDALGLDPELFKYQREMNADEGDADELFAFRTHDAFIDFLLNAVTDLEGPTQLASNVDGYAEKLRERERLQLEQQFVKGALERLGPLVAAAEQRENAQRQLRETQRDAGGAHQKFAAAARAAAIEQENLSLRAEQQEARARTLETRNREFSELLRELRRRAAQFKVDAAAEALREAEAARELAQGELAAWRATEPLARHQSAAARVAVLDEQLASAEKDAVPLMEQRASAARAYVGALLALIAEARDVAEKSTSAATASSRAAEDQEEAAGVARERAGRLREKAASAQSQLDGIAAQRERLIGEGLLGRGQSVDGALDLLSDRESDAERREQEASQRITAIDQRVSVLATEQAEQRAAEARANERAAQLDDERVRLRQRADELAASERMRELAGVEQIDVWRMAGPLRQALVEAAAKTERDTVLLELEAADDRHAVRTLQETGRLPADRDAQDAVQALQRSGIPAVSGWDYLAESVRPGEREALLRRLPELVGGVVITNAAHRERAEAVLVAAALKPTTVIALGDSAELAEPPQNDHRERFVVAPNAALYDDQVGEDELELRSERLARVDQRRARLDALYRSDLELRHTFDAFLTDCPAGRLDALGRAVQEQRQLANDAAEAAEAARGEQSDLQAERPQCEAAAARAREELRELAAMRPRLVALAERAANERALRETVRTCGDEAGEAEEAASKHFRAAQEQHRLAQQANRFADEHRRHADTLADELRQVSGAGDDVESSESGQSLDMLKQSYELATRRLAAATTESELAAEHRRAQSEAAEARARLEEHGREALTRAGELLGLATDRPARLEGERRAERDAQSAEERRAECRTEHHRCEDELRRETPRDESGRGPRAQLTEDLIPHDLDHALVLQRRLDADRARAVEDGRAATEAAQQARERATKAASRAEVIDSYADAVASALTSSGADFDPEGTATAAPFSGDLEEARAQMRAVTAALQSARNAMDSAQEQVREHALRVARFAGDDAFEAMAGGNLRERLARDEPDVLARRSGELLPHMQARSTEVAKELASIEQHRRLLLQRLASLVQSGLNQLRQAGRASRLPTDLGDWSGKQFLRVDFEVPESEDVLLERLGDVLDSAVSDGAGRNRDGMTMLLRGVRAAVEPRGFRVTVLKPDTVLRDERVPVTAMGEFSGGQRLTAAIALYCTLAAMRSTSRGRRTPRAGVLFLDNPIGTASAEYLLDIQLKVAERVGVQLVYTTGVFDLNALSKFPCVVRLRNDLDMRAGMQRIRIAEPLRAALLKGHPEHDGSGYLDVARVVHDRSDAPSAA